MRISNCRRLLASLLRLHFSLVSECTFFMSKSMSPSLSKKSNVVVVVVVIVVVVVVVVAVAAAAIT